MITRVTRIISEYYIITCFMLPFLFFACFAGAWFHGDDFTVLATLTGDWSVVLYRILTAQTFQAGSDVHYRPLANLLAALSYQSNSVIGHLISAVLHAVSALLVFLLCKKITKNEKSAWMSWAFFVCYPPLTTAIFWIRANGDLLTTLFALLTVLIYTDEKKSIKNWLLLFIFFSCSLLSKEMSLTLPAVLFVYSAAYKRLKIDLYKLALLFLIALLFFILRTKLLGHILMGSYDGYYFASLTNPLISFAKYFYSMLVYIPLSLTAENYLYYLGSLPVLAFLLILFFSLPRQNRLKILLISVLLFVIVYAPVSGMFSAWRLYYPGALMAIGLGIMISQSQNGKWKKFLHLHCLISVVVTASIGVKFIEAGDFSRNLTAAVHQLPDKEVTLAALPVAYGSYSPLLSNYQYLEFSLQHFYQDKRSISYAVPQTASDLPKSVVLLKVVQDTMVFKVKKDTYAYFRPDTESMGKICFTFTVANPNLLGKPTETKIAFKCKDGVYYLK